MKRLLGVALFSVLLPMSAWSQKNQPVNSYAPVNTHGEVKPCPFKNKGKLVSRFANTNPKEAKEVHHTTPQKGADRIKI